MRNGDGRWLPRNSCRHAGRRRANACLVLDFRGRSSGAAIVARMVSLLISHGVAVDLRMRVRSQNATAQSGGFCIAACTTSSSCCRQAGTMATIRPP
jgi:hypothetical protein